jgi:hypothetical protein
VYIRTETSIANWIWQLDLARGPAKSQDLSGRCVSPTCAHEQAVSADVGHPQPQIGVIEDIENSARN